MIDEDIAKKQQNAVTYRTKIDNKIDETIVLLSSDDEIEPKEVIKQPTNKIDDCDDICILLDGFDKISISKPEEKVIKRPPLPPKVVTKLIKEKPLDKQETVKLDRKETILNEEVLIEDKESTDKVEKTPLPFHLRMKMLIKDASIYNSN